jgi:hypothetical protein
MLPLLEKHCSIAPLTFLASILHFGPDIANLGLRPRLATAANHSCCPHPHPFLARWNNADPQMCATLKYLIQPRLCPECLQRQGNLVVRQWTDEVGSEGGLEHEACSARPALCGRVSPPSYACTLRSRYVMHDLPGAHVVHGTCAWHLRRPLWWCSLTGSVPSFRAAAGGAPT